MKDIIDYIINISTSHGRKDEENTKIHKYLRNEKNLKKINKFGHALLNYFLNNKNKMIILFISVRKFIFNKIKEFNDIDDNQEILVYEMLKKKYKYYNNFFFPNDHIFIYDNLITLLDYNFNEFDIDINKLFNDFLEKSPLILELQDIIFVDNQKTFTQMLMREDFNEIYIMIEELFEKIIDFFLYLNKEDKLNEQIL